MKRGAFVLTVSLLAVIAAGCCMRFDDFTPGEVYNVGDSFVDEGVTVEVERFQQPDGGWADSGSAKIDDRGMAGHNVPDINCNNVNLHFHFDYPKNKLTLRFGDYGGNTNVEINGELKNVGRTHELDGMTVGGVAITIDAVQIGNYDQNWVGKITFEGVIEDFKIGGQELWIDNVCKP